MALAYVLCLFNILQSIHNKRSQGQYAHDSCQMTHDLQTVWFDRRKDVKHVLVSTKKISDSIYDYRTIIMMLTICFVADLNCIFIVYFKMALLFDVLGSL